MRAAWQLGDWDHPRGCGAHSPPNLTMSSLMGSSPRVRGSRHGRDGLCPWPGIIPAGAGLTKDNPEFQDLLGDHPRGCGAHVKSAGANIGARGSSPRVRGSQSTSERMLLKRGIIPAGAGLTTGSTASARQERDHPRGCGAHGRGRVQNGSAHGIIPAGAGLTTSCCCSGLRWRDHPRGCGAHDFDGDKKTFCRGSSPRVRGSLPAR